ncbi:uncharacterized protein LOC143365166 [Halictus rubicundus]|uniref:uncharacterized protein LOC143365166 n=1 Tax=Halictus rubicundus TaxID=77578 RepID=UPI004036EEA1
MAAPMTELLFLFLLGIASWSCCVAENTVTLTGISCAPADGNKVLESFECTQSNNLFHAKINVKESCPGEIQSNMEVLKGGNVVNTFQQTQKQVPNDIRGLNVCESVDGPDPDSDECSAAQGELSVENCDPTSFFSDADADNYDVNIEYSMGGDIIGTAKLEVKVEAA